MIVKCVLCENPLCLALIGVTQRQRRFLHGCSSQRHLNVACPFCGTRFALVGGMIDERRVRSSYLVRHAIVLTAWQVGA